VDAAYRRLLGASLARLEATAASDPKYSERLRLENTSYLAAALGPLAGRDAVLREAAQVGVCVGGGSGGGGGRCCGAVGWGDVRGREDALADPAWPGVWMALQPALHACLE
jgi:hypothetical protein